jgi:Flp pilus assembly protein TadG
MTRDDGGMSAELAVLAPALLLCMLFVVFAGRLGQAQQDVTQAAAEAARAASLARGPQLVGVRDIVRRNLTAAGVRCGELVVDTSSSDWRPGGSVRVDVRCDVDLSGVAGLGLPWRRTVEADAVEVIDTYRGGG